MDTRSRPRARAVPRFEDVETDDEGVVGAPGARGAGLGERVQRDAESGRAYDGGVLGLGKRRRVGVRTISYRRPRVFLRVGVGVGVGEFVALVRAGGAGGVLRVRVGNLLTIDVIVLRLRS